MGGVHEMGDGHGGFTLSRHAMGAVLWYKPESQEYLYIYWFGLYSEVKRPKGIGSAGSAFGWGIYLGVLEVRQNSSCLHYTRSTGPLNRARRGRSVNPT